jgi:hypothetical protein
MAYTDAFTNSDGVSLASHNANWVVPTGGSGLEIHANSASAITGSTHSANYYNQTFADKHYSKVLMLSSGVFAIAGPAIRIQSGANSFYYAYIDAGTGTVYAGECISGTGTDWDAGQSGFSLTDEIELAIDATTSTTVHLKKNGTIVQTYTGKSALSGGRAGVAAYFTNSGIDSWEGGDVAGGGAPVAPLAASYYAMQGA